MPGFIQIIEFSTSRIDEVDALVEELMTEMEGQMTVGRSIETADRDHSGRYLTIVEFDSYEEAMKNSNNPSVSKFAERFASLADGPPVFHNLDVRAIHER